MEKDTDYIFIYVKVNHIYFKLQVEEQISMFSPPFI